jgi:tRNA (guanine-N7-)-methyltransferase
MPRRKVLRFLKTKQPEPQMMEKYLLLYDARKLYVQPSQFPPISSQALFANTQPLELEIGCGSGEYLCSLADQDPSANFVGVDRSLKALYLAVDIASELKLENIKFIGADMRQLYPLLPEASLRAAYLHFPEPLSKQRDIRKHRLFTPDFLDQFYRALQPGGTLSVVSDDKTFFLHMLSIAEQDQRFEKAHEARFLIGFEAAAKSRFQRIWEGHAIVPLRFVLRKRSYFAETYKGL